MSDATQICPRCGRTEAADAPFCYCGHVFAPADVSYALPVTRPDVSPSDPLPCPVCGKRTDSLKCFRFARAMLFLIVYVTIWEETFIACPRCMRQILRRRLLANIPSAHLLWPALLLIYIPRYAATYAVGHSRALVEPPRRSRLARLLDALGEHRWQYVMLIVGGCCTASLAFGHGRHEWFDTSRLIFAVLLGLFIGRVVVDVWESQFKW